jgi:hypothetical protein
MVPAEIMTEERLIEIMAKGFPWEERAAEMGPFVKWKLEEDSRPGALYRNSDMTTALLEAVGASPPMTHACRQAVASYLSSIGKHASMADYVMPGPTINIYNRPVKTRLWKSPGVSTYAHPADERELETWITALRIRGYSVTPPRPQRKRR